MSDLISRADLVKHLDDVRSTPPELQYVWPVITAIKCFVEEMPTIDAVPVEKIHFTDLYLDGMEAIAVFKFGNHGITLRKKCEDFAPVVHGRWEKLGEADYKCSVCGFRFTSGDPIELFTHCRCGAKMDGEADG
jgi:hypothetical protein